MTQAAPWGEVIADTPFSNLSTAQWAALRRVIRTLGIPALQREAAMKLLTVAERMKGDMWASWARLEQWCGASEATLKRLIRALEKADLVQRAKRWVKDKYADYAGLDARQSSNRLIFKAPNLAGQSDPLKPSPSDKKGINKVKVGTTRAQREQMAAEREFEEREIALEAMQNRMRQRNAARIALETGLPAWVGYLSDADQQAHGWPEGYEEADILRE